MPMAKVLTYGVSGQIAEYGNEMGQVKDPWRMMLISC